MKTKSKAKQAFVEGPESCVPRGVLRASAKKRLFKKTPKGRDVPPCATGQGTGEGTSV